VKNVILDIETCPMEEARLLKLMPEHIANPVMPLHIANPAEPEIGEPPKYATKEHPQGDPERQKEWRDAKLKSAAEKAEAAKDTWRLSAMESKSKFISNAALDAHTAAVRVLGLWDLSERERQVIIVGATREQQRRIQNGKYNSPASFHYLVDEMEAMAFFAAFVKSNIRTRAEAADGAEEAGRFIGYNIADFDLRLLFRKAMLEGVLPPWRLRRGRYWSDEMVVDLREVWQLGDRQYAMGGLDGLSFRLGCKRKPKTGELFWKMWQEDPVDALNYHIDEASTIRECAEKMGVL
jgi:hypothetical protein